MAQLTPIPSPSLWHLLQARFTSVTDEELLIHMLNSSQDEAFLFPKSCLGLRVCMEILQQDGPINLLIPELFCNDTLINMIPNEDCQVRAYKLLPTLEPDPIHLVQQCDSNKKNVLLLVHYFGQLINFDAIASTLKNHHDLFIIEDCAHHLRSNTLLGQVGDISIFSPYKQLPVPEGAALVIHHERCDTTISQRFKTAYANIQRTCPAHSHKRWLLKRVIQRYLPIKRRTSSSSTTPPRYADSKMSTVSKQQLKIALRQIDALSTAKQHAHAVLSRYLNQHYPSLQVLPLSPSTPCPYHLSVYADSPSDLDQLNDIPACKHHYRWPDLPPFISETPIYEIANLYHKHYTHIPLHNPVTL